MSKLLFVCVLILSLTSASFSIHFDEYDPDVIPQDIYDVDDPCFHVGARCDYTEECCGTATCVLPSWSPSPVCLVPGYKEDEKLERMSSHNPPRREDILYLRNTYNTTFFDFLLSDFTTASPLQENEVVANLSTEVRVDDASAANNNIGSPGLDLEKNAELKFSASQKMDNEKELKMPLWKKYLEQKQLELLKHKVVPLPTDFEFSSEKNGEDYLALKLPMDLTKLSQGLKLVLGRRHRFLLINSTLTTNKDGKPTINEIYEVFKNSDQYKIVIELLQEKLRRLNEKEIGGSSNVTLVNDDVINSRKNESFKTIAESSKWNLVKQFFIHKQSNGGNNVKENKFVGIQKEPVEPRKVEGIESLMEKFYGSNIKDDDDKAEKGPNVDLDKSEVEVFNINIPYRSAGSIEEFKESKRNKDLEKSLSSLTKTLSAMTPKSYVKQNKEEDGATLFKSFSAKSFEDLEADENNINVEVLNYQKYLDESFNTIKDTLNSLKHKNFNVNNEGSSKTTKSTMKRKSVNIVKINKGHSIKGDHLRSAQDNSSSTLTDKFKNMFFWKRKPKKHEKKPLRITNHLLLSVNSKNFSEKMADYYYSLNSEPSETDSPEFSFDSSSSKESASHYSEGLYNSSYVFMVRNGNSSSEKKQSKLESVLQFFHSAIKAIPCPRDQNPCVNSSGNLCNPNRENSTTEEVIFLPESLMPEALELKNANDSSEFWYFDESEETLNESVVEHTGIFNFVLF